MKYIYESKLSEHIVKDNIGQLICIDVPIARSGTQDYLEDEVHENGSSNIIKLKRPWAVVKESAPSFEGKPFVVVHPKPDITVDNIYEFHSGHIQNVRAVDETELLIADIVVSKPEAIELIENKEMRDISCGYFYEIDDNNTVTKIVGEHVALVEAGRAGNTKILDAALKPFNNFLSCKKAQEIKVGDWIYAVTNRDNNFSFVEVTKIMKNNNEFLFLVNDYNEKLNPLVFVEDEEIEGLFGDIKTVEVSGKTEEDKENDKEVAEALAKAEPKLEDAKTDTWIYAVYGQFGRSASWQPIAWLGIDRDMHAWLVDDYRDAAMFTTPDHQEEIDADQRAEIEEEVNNRYSRRWGSKVKAVRVVAENRQEIEDAILNV